MVIFKVRSFVVRSIYKNQIVALNDNQNYV